MIKKERLQVFRSFDGNREEKRVKNRFGIKELNRKKDRNNKNFNKETEDESDIQTKGQNKK